MKLFFIICLVSLLLVGCRQPEPLNLQDPLPSSEPDQAQENGATREIVPTLEPQLDIILAEEQTVKVAFTEEALEKIAQDLGGQKSQGKFLKIKPAID